VADEIFAVQLGRFAKLIPERARAAVRKATLDLASGVVLTTPVGNPTLWKNKPPKGYVGGRLRANWNPAIGSADETTTNATDPSGADTIARIESVLGTWTDGDIYVTNSLPYAVPVEYGHSSIQAPAGMVRVTVTHWQTYVDSAVKELQA
jgi:hypothetical protein